MKWTHDELASDLAKHLKLPDRLVWLDMQMGAMHSPRPDVFTMEKSFARPMPTSYECKISVSDFRADITAGKWQSYLAFSGAVTFAVPAKLISKADVPNGCGLMIRGDDGWSTVKRPTRQVSTFSRDHAIKLLIDGWGRELNQVDTQRADAFKHRALKKLKAKFGEEVTNIIHDLDNAKGMVAYYKERQDQLIASTKKATDMMNSQAAEAVAAQWKELRETVGLPETAHQWDIRNAVRRLQNAQPTAKEDALNRAIQQIAGICENVQAK